MMRTLFAFLSLAALSVPFSQASGNGQPEPQPQPNPAPRVRVFAAGHSYLGVDIRDITKDRLEPLKLKEERGVEITMVDQDAPAGKAGLREHDVILDYNGTAVQSEEQLRRLIRETPPGRTVALGISRDGNPMKVNVTLADHSKVASRHVLEMPALPEPPDVPSFNIPGNIYVLRNTSALLGVQTENLTSQLGDFFGVKNGEGVLVRSVEKGSPAEKGGLKAGDVIVRIGDEKLSDRSDFSRLMRKHRTGGKLNLGVVRDKHEQTFTVELPARNPGDSSRSDMATDQLEAFADQWDSMEPEIEAAREVARLDIQDSLRKAMQQYKKGMKEYEKALRNDEFKGLGKQFEKQQKELEMLLHPML